MQKSAFPSLLAIFYLLPTVLFAHGDGDGHEEMPTDLPDTSVTADAERQTVAIVLGVAVVLVAAVLWFLKKKNAPAAPVAAPANDQNPPVAPPTTPAA